MKMLTFLLAILLSANSFANEIDKLQTAADVNTFLIEKLGERFNKPPLATDSTVKNFDKHKFYKVDIDNNGLTDLIVNGSRFLVVVDKGREVYGIHYFDTGFVPVLFIEMDTLHLPKKIMVLKYERPWNKPDSVAAKRVDTLIYQFNGFIELNPNPMVDFSFKELRFKTSGCYGTCAIFEMIIYKNKTATYTAIQFTKEKGNFWGAIPKDEFDEFIALLKYIKIPELDQEYSVDWTDDQTFTTEIKYNGTKKYVSDYGARGTYGLALLYDKINHWRKSIEWKE